MLTRGLVACIVVVLAGLVPGVGRASADTAFSCTPSSGTLGGLQVLRHVTATTEAGFDRVTFEFATLPAPAGVGATFTVSAATPPFTSGASGQPLAIGGLSFVKVAFHNGYLQDPVNATPTVSYAGPLDLKLGLPVLTEAAVSDASEGFLTWILGLGQKACWRVTQSTAPVRLTVELQQRALPVTGSPTPTLPLAAAGLAALIGGLLLRRRLAATAKEPSP